MRKNIPNDISAIIYPPNLLPMTNQYQLQVCVSDRSLSEAFQLRYRAYRNVGAIDENAEALFRDQYDLMPNSQTGIVYEENVAVASVRACIYSPEHQFLQVPGLEVYRDDIDKSIGLDKVIIESNRLVIDPAKVDSKELFKIPFRFIILHALKFNADYVMAAVRAKHVPVYQRFLGMHSVSTPKKYPGINVDMIMMVADCGDTLTRLMNKEAIFNVTEEEVRNYEFFEQPALA